MLYHTIELVYIALDFVEQAQRHSEFAASIGERLFGCSMKAHRQGAPHYTVTYSLV